MKNKDFLTLTIIIFTALAAVLGTLSPAHAANWQTVQTITGSSGQTTSTFSIPANEWRIQWSYTPDPQYPTLSVFYFYVYPQGETANYVDMVSADGNIQTSNTQYMYKGEDNYYLKIIVANIPSYTIIIQQDQDTFPSNTSTTGSNHTTIGLLAIVVLIVILIAVRVQTRRNQRSAQPLPPTNPPTS